MTQEEALKIPLINDNTVKYYVDGEYIGDLNPEQFNVIREKVIKYIIETKDISILDRFYIIGHQDSNDKPGPEQKMTLDVYGNIIEWIPWEMSHIRRSLRNILTMEMENDSLFQELSKKIEENKI